MRNIIKHPGIAINPPLALVSLLSIQTRVATIMGEVFWLRNLESH